MNHDLEPDVLPSNPEGPKNIGSLYVSDRTLEEFLSETHIATENQLKTFISGKKIVSAGGGLFQKIERYIAENGAQEVIDIDPTLGLQPNEWSVRKSAVGKARSDGITYYHRDSSWHIPDLLSPDSFHNFQRERLQSLPKNLSFDSSFLPPWPTEIKEQDIIFDVYGPAFHIKNTAKKALYIPQVIDALTTGGYFIISPLDEVILTLLQNDPILLELHKSGIFDFYNAPELNGYMVIRRLT